MAQIDIDVCRWISRMEKSVDYRQDLGSQITGKDLGDAKGHKTYGPGLLVHPVQNKYMDEVKSVWSSNELWDLFDIKIAKDTETLKQSFPAAATSPARLGCMISWSYNFGSGWPSKNTTLASKIKANPDDQSIIGIITNWGSGQWGKYPGLKKRRAAEANIWKTQVIEWNGKIYSGGGVSNVDGSFVDSGGSGGSGGSTSSVTAPPNAPRAIMASRGANTVYQLDSATKRNVMLLSEGRKQKFSNFADSFLENAPELGRDIIKSGEMYNPSILKSSQQSKTYRK